MHPGVVGLRGALIAAWEEDLRAVRQDRFDMGRGREALMFMQRLYGLITERRTAIQRAWGPRGHVHVVASEDIAGPGCRVSQSRIRLRNRGETVAVELFSYADGASHPNPSAGLDRIIRVAGVEPVTYVTDLYRTAVDFLSFALGIDLSMSGSSWLYEHAAARCFLETASWPAVGEVYRRVAKEFAVEDSYESVVSRFAAGSAAGHGSNGSNGTASEVEMRLSVAQLQRYEEARADLENLLKVVRMAVEADQGDWRVTSVHIADALGLREQLPVARLGRLIASESELCREGSFSVDMAEWSFLPSYNIHFFRRVHTVEDYVAIETSLVPRAAVEGTTTTSPGGTSFKVEESSPLPDGIVTFLMTDVVESTSLWLQSRSAMYRAMRRHDALLGPAIEANGGTVLKERGEGDSFFAVFPRATDAVVAAVEAQRALLVEEWPDRLPLRVRMAVLTGEADALDRDYRSPAVNRCAKLRRRAVGGQILVSETTYSIVADILRDDITLVSVGKRRLEGHDRPEEIYVVQHSELDLEAEVEGDLEVIGPK